MGNLDTLPILVFEPESESTLRLQGHSGLLTSRSSLFGSRTAVWASKKPLDTEGHFHVIKASWKTLQLWLAMKQR